MTELEQLENLADLGVLLGIHEVELLSDIGTFLSSANDINLGSLEDFLKQNES